MLHIQNRCPYCGRITADNTTVFSGSPVRECMHCRQLFIDNKFREPAYYDPPAPTHGLMPFVLMLWPFGVATIILLVVAIVAVDHISGLLLPAMPLIPYLYLVWKCYQTKDLIHKEKLEEYARSKKRLQDREYVILLLDHDCKVPRYVLTSQHPDLLGYKPKKGHLPHCIDNSFFT